MQTVIIPVRNESINISTCLNSLDQQSLSTKYFEIIVVDDHSTDHTIDIISKNVKENLRLIQLSNISSHLSGKKDALTEGIKAAQNEIIITTDADCTFHTDWIKTMLHAYDRSDPVMITGPVKILHKNTLVTRFQTLDLIGMMGVTGGGINSKKLYLANGANLSFRKTAFEKVGGYEGINDIASGDDVLLIQKFQSIFSERINFIKSKSAIVKTQAIEPLKQLYQQRLRWASKNKTYTSGYIQLVQMIVFSLTLWIVFSFLAMLLYDLTWWRIFFLAFAGKLAIDYMYLSGLTTFFNERKLLQHILPLSMVSLAYITIMGLAGLVVKKYRWKERQTQ